MADKLDSRVRHRRTPATLLKALLRPQNYTGVLRTLAGARNPIGFLYRYVGGGGAYPAKIALRTPIGPLKVTTWHADDVATVNEIFFRGDYDVGTDNKVVVDWGSNVGISALYFLTRAPDAFVYCFEPVAQNAARLRENLAGFASRYDLAEVAVGESDGTVRFGVEPTGKYGGVNRNTGEWIDVPCRNSNAVLREIIAKHGRIDLLKVDVETLEKMLVERIPADVLPAIRNLAVEYRFGSNPITATHEWERRNAVTAFTLR